MKLVVHKGNDREKPMKFICRNDGHIEVVSGNVFVLLSAEESAHIIDSCVQQYAKRAVVERLKALKDTDKEYPCFEGMSVSEILADTALIDSIAAGLVGSWDLDLAEDEHVDNEIAFWIKERSESK